MGDLAVAIVGLAQSATERRGARKELREAVSTVTWRILDHMRSGDYAAFAVGDGADQKVTHFYVAEKVTYPLTLMKPDGGAPDADDEVERFSTSDAIALVRYTGGPARIADDPETWPQVEGASMHDPWEPWEDLDGVTYVPAGRDIIPVRSRTARLGYHGTIHLATEDELLDFADEAQQLVNVLSHQFTKHARQLRVGASRLVKLEIR